MSPRAAKHRALLRGGPGWVTAVIEANLRLEQQHRPRKSTEVLKPAVCAPFARWQLRRWQKASAE
jgi:hypothetical protein